MLYTGINLDLLVCPGEPASNRSLGQWPSVIAHPDFETAMQPLLFWQHVLPPPPSISLGVIILSVKLLARMPQTSGS